jgi:hypothetical protein
MSSDVRGKPMNGAKILELLSAGEMASLKAAAVETHLRRGDEYLHLEHLERGVLRADGTATSLDALLPRKAIHEDTWRRILRHLKGLAALAPPTPSG